MKNIPYVVTFFKSVLNFSLVILIVHVIVFECECVQLCIICVCVLVSASLAYFHLYYSARTGIVDPEYAAVCEFISVSACM